jgi:hypothetical protein
MRRALALLLILPSLAGILSCSDMPTAPRTIVTIEGSVLDRDGAPMSAAVFFDNGSAPNPSGYAYTDARGAFKVAVLEGQYQVRIAVQYTSGYPNATVPNFKVDRSKPRLDYRFSGTKVSGDVMGPGGTLLTGAYVACNTGSFESSTSAVTVNGHYSLFVPPGLYSFGIDPPTYDGGMPHVQEQAQVGSTDTTMNFSLSGYAVTATVTMGGSPISGAGLQAQRATNDVSASGRTGPDGTAVLYLPAGDYYYFVYPPVANIVGPEQGALSISADISIPVTFPATRWNGTLRRASDNTPIPAVYVRATEILSSRTATASTSPFGAFQLSVRPNVGYSLEIDYPYGSQVGPFFVPYVASTADSTFDLMINAP